MNINQILEDKNTWVYGVNRREIQNDLKNLKVVYDYFEVCIKCIKKDGDIINLHYGNEAIMVNTYRSSLKKVSLGEIYDSVEKGLNICEYTKHINYESTPSKIELKQTKKGQILYIYYNEL
jgi:hypothetical protein